MRVGPKVNGKDGIERRDRANAPRRCRLPCLVALRQLPVRFVLGFYFH